MHNSGQINYLPTIHVGFICFTKFGDFFIYNIILCGEGILTGCPESMVEIYETGMRAKNIG